MTKPQDRAHESCGSGPGQQRGGHSSTKLAGAAGLLDAFAKADPTTQALASALTNLLEFVVSGRRYENRNPYTIGEVQDAYKALGRDWRKE